MPRCPTPAPGSPPHSPSPPVSCPFSPIGLPSRWPRQSQTTRKLKPGVTSGDDPLKPLTSQTHKPGSSKSGSAPGHRHRGRRPGPEPASRNGPSAFGSRTPAYPRDPRPYMGGKQHLFTSHLRLESNRVRSHVLIWGLSEINAPCLQLSGSRDCQSSRDGAHHREAPRSCPHVEGCGQRGPRGSPWRRGPIYPSLPPRTISSPERPGCCPSNPQPGSHGTRTEL